MNGCYKFGELLDSNICNWNFCYKSFSSSVSKV